MVITLLLYILPIFLIAALWAFLFFVHNLQDTTKNNSRPHRKQKTVPLIGIPLISLMAGIYCMQHLALTGILIVGIAIPGILLVKREWFYAGSIAIFFFSGILLLFLQKESFYQNITALAHTPLTIRALVIDKTQTPYERHKETLTLLIRNIDHPKASLAPHFLVCYQQRKTPIVVGNTIILKNITLSPPIRYRTTADHPPFAEYQIKENILATLFLKKADYQIEPDTSFSLTRTLAQTRHALFARLAKKLSAPVFSYFSPIFLGNKKTSTQLEERKSFLYWGISHYLARSGIHIALFLLVWKKVLSTLPFFIFLKHFLLMIMTLAYALLSWPSISFFRALFFFIFCQIGLFMGRQINLVHILSVLCFLVLILNPLQLFFLDFQLSFALTGTLLLLRPAPQKQKSMVSCH